MHLSPTSKLRYLSFQQKKSLDKVFGLGHAIKSQIQKELK